jgi:glycogen(starch) synthase
MRVLQLSWEYPPLVYGGLGRHVHALSEALAAAGHEVTVVTQEVDGSPADETVHGVRILRVAHDLPQLPQSDLLAWVMAFNHGTARAALRVGRERPYDVVHAHDWLVTHAATTVKEALGLPLVATLHATEAGRHQGWLPTDLSKAIHALEWWLTYQARRVITCSAHMQWEATRLFELPPDSVDVVPNGIDLDRWSVSSEAAFGARRAYAAGGPLIIYTGRLEYEKGVHTLLRAMPRLRRRFPGIRLVVAGQGTYADELRALTSQLRLGPSVRFVGWLAEEQLIALAAAADCAVVPSLYEPFGMVALEAAACGTPLVVGDTGGLREFVDHGITGLRFTPDDVPGLADAVTSLLRDEVLARRMSRDARQVLDREYRWSAIAARTVEVYERAAREEAALLAAHAPAPSGRPPQPALRVAVGEGNLLRDRD